MPATALRVHLLSKTEDAENVLYAAFKQCYSAKDAHEIFADAVHRRHIGETEIIQAQRALITRIMESGHDSPIEHVSFVFAIAGISRALSHQLVRHRIASYCLSGDTEVIAFKHNKSVPNKRWTLAQLYAMSQDPQRKGRLKLIRLRSVDDNGILVANKMVSIVSSGKQEVYRVSVKSGRQLKATMQHRFKTPGGYAPLSELAVGSRVVCNGLPAYQNKEWVEEHYRTKNMERKDVAALAGVSDACMGVWIRRFGLQKPKALYPGRKGGYGLPGMFSTGILALLSDRKKGDKNPAWKGDEASAQAGRLRCQQAFAADECEACGRTEGTIDRHHMDGNTLNNDEGNVVRLCPACHKAFHYGQAVLSVFTDEITAIDVVGVEDTYDIEMEAPHHNFVAEGFVVHNSQQSQRYVEASGGENILPYVIPPKIAAIPEAKERYAIAMTQAAVSYQAIRDLLIEHGHRESANEDARFVLPNACETKIVVTMNCRALLNFFELRCCNRAQWEIRAMAQEMLRLCREWLPVVFDGAGARCERLGYCPESEQFACGKYPRLALK